LGRILKKSTGEVSTGSTSPNNKTSYDKNSYGKEFKNRSSIENANKRLGLGESNNTYNITNKDGSSAKGKYQYLWRWHGDSIMKMFPQIKSDKDFLNNPEVQEKYHAIKMKENLAFAKTNLNKARKHHPNISVEDLMMLHHYQPETAKKFVRNEIDLNYVPNGGSKDYSNSSLGVYLYGKSFPGVKRWNARTQKYE